MFTINQRVKYQDLLGTVKYVDFTATFPILVEWDVYYGSDKYKYDTFTSDGRLRRDGDIVLFGLEERR